MIKEPCFDILRTKEQLGYLVWSMGRMRVGVCGIRFVIQSEYAPWHLHERIDAFIAAFAESLKEMTDASFQSFKTSRLKALAESDKNLGQEVFMQINLINAQNSKFYGHISSHYYDFNHKTLEAQVLEKLSLADIVEFYSGRVKHAGRFVVWMKSVKKCGDEWVDVEGIEVVTGDVQEFKNGLGFARGASSK